MGRGRDATVFPTMPRTAPIRKQYLAQYAIVLRLKNPILHHRLVEKNNNVSYYTCTLQDSSQPFPGLAHVYFNSTLSESHLLLVLPLQARQDKDERITDPWQFFDVLASYLSQCRVRSGSFINNN